MPSIAPEQRWRNEVARLMIVKGLESAAANFRLCGNITGVATCSVNQTHYQGLEVQTCHMRICPVCAKKDSQRLTMRYEDRLKQVTKDAPKGYRFRMITLTTDIGLFDPDINSDQDDYETRVDDLSDKLEDAIERGDQYVPEKPETTVRGRYRQAFGLVAKLFDNLLGRGRPYWSQKSHRKYTGEGYLVSAEFGENGRRLHFHVLFFGRYLDQAEISEQWASLTGCSVVWIEKLRHGLKDGLKEALKYVTKFSKSTNGAFAGFPAPEMIAQLALVFHGARRVRTRGLFYDMPTVEEILAEEDLLDQPEACPECLARIVRFDPQMWESMHARSTLDLLHLKQRNKFHVRTTSPPGRAVQTGVKVQSGVQQIPKCKESETKMTAYPTAPDGWTRITPDESKPYQFYIERGIAILTPKYNIDKITQPAYPGDKIDVMKAVIGWKVTVNGRYGGDFEQLDRAKASAQQSMEYVANKRVQRG